MKYSLSISNFLEAISSIFHSVIFLYFFALITEKVSLISPSYSLELCIQMSISFLFSFAFHFFSQWFVRPPQKTILPFCISLSWGWLWSLPPVQYHKPLFIALQALCLSDLIPWIYLSVLLFNCRDFIRSSPSGLVVFSYFLQFNSEFGNKEFLERLLFSTLPLSSSEVLSCSFFWNMFPDHLILPNLIVFYFYVSCRRCSMHPSSTSPLWKLELYGLGFPLRVIWSRVSSYMGFSSFVAGWLLLPE